MTTSPNATPRAVSFADACARYVHRYTLDHVPAWALQPCANGKYYAPQYASDREWYECTRFPGESSVPKRVNHCESYSQSWPRGQWLSQPFRKVTK